MAPDDTNSDTTSADDSPTGTGTGIPGLDAPDQRDARRGRQFALATALANGRDPPELDTEDAAAVGEFLHTNALYETPQDASQLRTRREAYGGAGTSHSGERDIQGVLGYPEPESLTPEDYIELYEEIDLAKAIVDSPTQTTWRNTPEIDDTPDEDSDDLTDFEQAVEELFQTDHLHRGLPYYWERADLACRLGQYSLLFFGFDDGRPAREEVDQSALSAPDDLRYIRPIRQANVTDWELARSEDDERDPGLPLEYTIKVERAAANGTVTYERKRVHYSRILHIADNPDGTRPPLSPPALQSVIPRLIDYQKVMGASAEMFWTGADRKFFFSEDTSGGSDTGISPGGAAAASGVDTDALNQQLRQMLHGMQPAMYGDNMEMEVIGGDDPDPSSIIAVIHQAVSAVTGIPQSVLKGNETGERATTQDLKEWYGKITERQAQFAEPVLVRATLDLLVDYGLLPEPEDGEYEINWPSLSEQDDKEVAETRNQTAQAIQRLENAASVSTLPRRYLYEEFFDIDLPDDIEDARDPLLDSDSGGPGQEQEQGDGVGDGDDAPPDAPEQPSPDDTGSDDGDGSEPPPSAVDETDVNVQRQWNVMQNRADAFATGEADD